MKNFWKTFLCFILVLSLLLCFTACADGRDDEDDDEKEGIYGRYYFVYLENYGLVMTKVPHEDEDGNVVAIGGEDCYMDYNEDGTADMVAGDDEKTLLWENGEMWLEEDESAVVEYEIDDGCLTLFAEQEDVTMVFAMKGVEVDIPDSDFDSNSYGNVEYSDTLVTDGGKFVVVGAERFEDKNGESAIRIYYDFTNTSEEDGHGGVVCEAEQDGYEMKWTRPDEYTSEVLNAGLRIRPGCTIRCVKEFSMKEDGGPLKFTMSASSVKSICVEFDPQNLPGRPEDLDIEPILNPEWTADYPVEGTVNGDYYVRIDSVETIEDNNGNKVLLAYFEFTNISDQAASLSDGTYALCYQDGIELENLNSWDYSEMPVYGRFIDPGETLLVVDCFALRSDSPVEIEVWDRADYSMALGRVFTLE